MQEKLQLQKECYFMPELFHFQEKFMMVQQQWILCLKKEKEELQFVQLQFHLIGMVFNII